MTLRFPLLAQPPAAPACCAACRRGTDPIGFFDTGLELDFWGRVYLCATDLLEMVATAGPALGLAQLSELEREQAARRSAEKALAAANAGEVAARRLLAADALAMIQNVTIEQLRLDMAARPPAPEQEDVPDAGSEPGPGPAGGGDAGSAGDAGSGDAGLPVRGPARPGHRTPSRSAARGLRGRPVAAAEPAAGQQGGGADLPAGAGGDLTGAAAGPGS